VGTGDINIHNTGKIAANINSPGSIAAIRSDPENHLAELAQDDEIKQHLAGDDEPEAKRAQIAARLTGLLGIATDFAANLAAQLIRQHGG
jgi:hypothetical protein